MNSSNQQNIYTTKVNTNVNLLPTADQWLLHAKQLLKFWLQDTAKGIPVGNFPTWRNNDGSILQNNSNTSYLDNSSVPRDLRMLFEHYCVDINTLLNRKYVRMMSRQTFAYGALYNLTGDKEALDLHQKGVRYLIEHTRDQDGIFYTFFENGHGFPKLKERAIQDLAGATLGLAMNVYLTHNEESLAVIDHIRHYIYNNCADHKTKILKWVLNDFEADKVSSIELAPQLDELNCYLLLLWRLLPTKFKDSWYTSIQESLNVIEKYFIKEDNSGLIYGSLSGTYDNPKPQYLANYGHGIKTWWMKDIANSMFAQNQQRQKNLQGLDRYMKLALAPDETKWFDDNEQHNASWWVWAELDQGMLHGALVSDTSIKGTLLTWINKLTDQEYGEVTFGQKQHFWRNGYHSSEHALVGYILSQAIRAKVPTHTPSDSEVTLHFAVPNFKQSECKHKKINTVQDVFTPYYYSGDIKNINNDGNTQEVTFVNIRAPETTV